MAVFADWTLGDWLTLAAAVPAGIGGCLLGDRAMGWFLARRAGRR